MINLYDDYHMPVHMQNAIRDTVGQNLEESYGPLGATVYHGAMEAGDSVVNAFIAGSFASGLEGAVSKEGIR